jgi:hypothetical protein
MSKFATFVTLILADVAALVYIVTVFTTMFTMTFPLLGSLQLGGRVKDTIGKG